MADLEQRFKAAQRAAKDLNERPDNDTLLELYSYFKQATKAMRRAPGRGPSTSLPAPSTTPGRPVRA